MKQKMGIDDDVDCKKKNVYTKLYTIKQKWSKNEAKSWEIKAKPKNMTAK